MSGDVEVRPLLFLARSLQARSLHLLTLRPMVKYVRGTQRASSATFRCFSSEETLTFLAINRRGTKEDRSLIGPRVLRVPAPGHATIPRGLSFQSAQWQSARVHMIHCTVRTTPRCTGFRRRSGRKSSCRGTSAPPSWSPKKLMFRELRDMRERDKEAGPRRRALEQLPARTSSSPCP